MTSLRRLTGWIFSRRASREIRLIAISLRSERNALIEAIKAHRAKHERVSHLNSRLRFVTSELLRLEQRSA